MSRPAVLFFPGSFMVVSVYQPIFDAVSDAGYDIKGLHPPSIGPSAGQGGDGQAPSMYEDAKALAQETETLADAGKDVIVIGHSYGGIPVSQGTKGLAKKDRQAQGKTGGVVRLAYIAAVVPGIGKSSGDFLSGYPTETRPSMAIDENGWLSMDDPAATAKIVAQDAPADVGEAVVRGFAKHSAASFGSELTQAGYEDIPSSWLFCEDDKCILPEAQRAGIETIEAVSGMKVDVTKVKCGHIPNITAKKETVDWILSLVKKAEEEHL